MPLGNVVFGVSGEGLKGRTADLPIEHITLLLVPMFFADQTCRLEIGKQG